MSKRLPYYQSEPAEYLSGDIMFCTYAAQGVFSIIRALYWQKDCKLTLKQAKRRCKGADDLITELIDENIIKIEKDFIIINFLDEQFDKATSKSKTNSENGKKGAKARWNKERKDSDAIATLSKKDGEHIALREDKIIEKKRDIETPQQINTLTEELFLKRWCDARTYYDKLPTNITKLTTFEKIDFKELLQDYKLKDFEQAMQGMFQQKTYLKTRLRPSHFLKRDNFETYLTCFTTKEKLFEDKKYKKPIERI